MSDAATDPVPAVDGVIRELADAADALEARREAVTDPGEDARRELADAIADARSLLERYEEEATGYGDFERYVAFQDDLVEFVEDLPGDLPERERFEELLDLFQKKTLSTSDFDEARRKLDAAADAVEPLDDLEDARERYDEARRAAIERRDALRERVDHLERLADLGEADLDAPVERVREPIETYNDAVREDFDEYLDGTAVREVLATVEWAQAFPLVGFDEPPDALREFVANHEAGTETIDQLLEYADYSRSKLDHYVEDPAALKRSVGGNRTYLADLSADPLTLAWPPRPAAELRFRASELVSVVARVADEETVGALHAVRERAREDDFAAIRRAAVARDELTAAERERAREGVADELATARERLDRLEDALEAYPSRR